MRYAQRNKTPLVRGCEHGRGGYAISRTWLPWVVCTPQDHGGEDDEELHELFAFAFVEHGLAEDGLAAQDAILLEFVETPEEGAAEVEGLEWL